MGRGLWEGPEVREESSKEPAVVLRRPNHIPKAMGSHGGFRSYTRCLVENGPEGLSPEAGANSGARYLFASPVYTFCVHQED